jgi:hypothetical protein
MDIWNGIPVIDDSTKIEDIYTPEDGRGGIPRDFTIQPREVFASADMIPPLPYNEWPDRIKQADKEEDSLDHVLLRARAQGRFTDLYQNGYGFCWGHSVAHAIQLAREVAHQPPVALSAFGLVHLADASRALNNRGGWCGLAAQAAREKGIPSQAMYPQLKVLRNVSQAILDDAKKYLVTEDFVDLEQPVWFQNLTFQAVGSALFTGRPCPVDFNFMAHSVCGLRIVQIEPGTHPTAFGLMYLDSHGLQKGDRGRLILRGSRARPDGAIAINTVRK